MKYLISFLFILMGLSTSAQNKWSIERCIEQAVNNNISIRFGKLTAEQNAIVLKQSRLSLLPSLNAGAAERLNFGRAINPFTNTFETNSTMGSSFFLSTNVSLFEGLSKQNSIKQNDALSKATEEDLNAVINQTILNTAGGFVDIIFNQERLAVSRLNNVATRKQLERTQTLFDAGAISKDVLLNLKAELANGELIVVNAENALEQSKLNLQRIMQIEYQKNFEVEYSGAPASLPNEDFALLEIYQRALEIRPEIRAAKMRIEASKYGLAMAQGAKSPRLSLSGNLSTIFSDQALTFVPTGEVNIQPGIGITTSGDLVNGFSPIFNSSVIPFGEQLNNNLGYSFTLNLSIPIFNGWSVSGNIENSKLNLKRSELQLEDTKLQLFQEINQLLASYTAAQKKYKANLLAFEAQEENFNFANVRFEEGLMNPVDYLSIKNNFESARSNLLQAKYDLIFSDLVLDYYLGREIRPN